MTLDIVRDYYGKVLNTSADLKTSACCDADAVPAALKPALGRIHDEVLAKYYGCGLVLPEALEGARILDLGCGAGRDVYLLAQLVGPKGKVVGVDMTPEQLEVARRHVGWHMKAFGYCCPNVEFVEGQIETLDQLGLEPASFDVIVSNCVINLSPDKRAVLAGARSLLKTGGEMYFADVYADRRLPDAVRSDPVLIGECLGGALYWGDFLALARETGFIDARLVGSRAMTVDDPRLEAKTRPARFFSATYRLFKAQGLEPACEDYGQAVIYKGGIAGAEEVLRLDSHHTIEHGRVFPVCGNTWNMLKQSRLAPYFEFIGDFSRHYGIFPGCGTSLPFADAGRIDNATVSTVQAASSGSCC